MLVPSFERGALLLRAEDGRLFRLSWEEPPAPGADRRRALPAGTYALAGYRLLGQDERGRPWHLSATAPSIRALELASGSEQRVEIDPAIRIEKRVRDDQLQVGIQGENGAGLSIYQGGKRIPLGFELYDRSGKKLGEGKINYG